MKITVCCCVCCMRGGIDVIEEVQRAWSDRHPGIHAAEVTRKGAKLEAFPFFYTAFRACMHCMHEYKSHHDDSV